MAGVTLEDCVREFSISEELLYKRISDDHILEVSMFSEWRTVARWLKLNDSEVRAINSEGNSEQEKQQKTLQMWTRKFAFKATYKRLIEALLESGRADHAEKVCQKLSSLAAQKGICITW